MPFVKLDCGMLNSTTWFDRDAREIFITSLLMAEPRDYDAPAPQIAVRKIEPTGWVMPPGQNYGFVAAASVGIIRRAGIDEERGLLALERLGEPDPESRSKDFDGRRMIRVDGGFVILNYGKYRERDYTAAMRAKRYREKKKDTKSRHAVTSRDATPDTRNVTPKSRRVTQAEAEGEVQTTTTPQPNGGWVGEAVGVWKTNRGEISHGRIGKALKAVVASIGEPETLRRFRIFAAGKKGGFNPEYFAANHKDFTSPQPGDFDPSAYSVGQP